MKKWIVLLLGFTLLLSSCARFRKQNTTPILEPLAPATVEESTAEETQVEHPDFASMSFVEKNNLYMQLLNEKISAGADTSLAESEYQKSIEASLAGDSAEADRALEEAILFLLNL